MKERKRDSLRMIDMMKDDESPLSKQQKRTDNSFEPITYTDEYFNQIQKYNKELEDLDPDFASFKPTSKVLVRAAVVEPFVDESGLIYANMATVAVNTPNGMTHKEIEQPYGFANLAVVVAAPEHSPYKQGDKVMLSFKAIQCESFGNTKIGFKIVPANAFLKPTVINSEIPKKVTEKDFGYLLVNAYEIEGIL